VNLDFSEDQKLLKQMARDYLKEHAPIAAARAVLESDAAYDAKLWQGIAELGWLGTALPETFGGAGFGALELAVLAEEIGRALAPIPFSTSVYLASEAIRLAGSEEQKARFLPRLASGEWIGTFAVAEGPGIQSFEALRTSLKNGRLSGRKWPVPDGECATFAIAAARSDRGPTLVLVDLSVPHVKREPVPTLDPSRSLSALAFEACPAEVLGPEGNGADLWERLADRAAVLLAFEQLGGAERAFELTREFTLGRYAFGRPIASFQAVKHRMADLWVKLELARSNCYYGAWALSTDADELPVAACAAHLSAGDAFETATTEMLQLYGGVGFTWEYDCHLFLRRAKFCSLLLGGPLPWREKLVERAATQNRFVAAVDEP